MELKVGDSFIIDSEKVNSIYPNIKPCKFFDKEFIVDHFSKSGESIYYYDKRTSRKCDCNLCEINTIGYKCVSKHVCLLRTTKLSRDRDLKLKSILK